MKPPLIKALLLALLGLAGALLLLAQPAALGALPEGEAPGGGFWAATLLLAALAVQSVRQMAALDGSRWVGLATAALFGLWIVYFWQLLVVAFAVPRVLLPPPGLILLALGEHREVLWGDFVQTVLKAAGAQDEHLDRARRRVMVTRRERSGAICCHRMLHRRSREGQMNRRDLR